MSVASMVDLKVARQKAAPAAGARQSRLLSPVPPSRGSACLLSLHRGPISLSILIPADGRLSRAYSDLN
jgi:hypothetical protein